MKKIENLDVSLVDIENKFFKFTKSNSNEDLIKSIELFGILEKPILLKKNDNYLILSGFSRIKILKELNIDSFDAIVFEKIDVNAFLEIAHMEIFNDKVTPAGKLKILVILQDFFKYDFENNFKLLRNSLVIPDEFLKNSQLLNNFFSLPLSLIEYFDKREINFKLIRTILNLKKESLDLISFWTRSAKFKNNILKNIVDMISDIERRDESLPPIEVDFSIENFDKIIYDKIYKIRYPQFSQMKSELISKISTLEKNGLKIKFPEYFEGNKFEIIFQISKKNGVENMEKSIRNLDYNQISTLLEYL